MSASELAKNPTGATSSSGSPPPDFLAILQTDVGTFSNNMDASLKWLASGIVEMMKKALEDGEELIVDMPRQYGRSALAEVALGYTLCLSCEKTVATEIAQVTGGRCGECYRDELANPRGRELDVLVEGARSVVSVGGPRKRSGSKGNKKTRRKVEAAKRRALRRLRHAHPAEYELMLAYERSRAGLDPVPLEHAVRVGTVDTTAT